MEFKRVATDEEIKEYNRLTNESYDLFCAYESLDSLIAKRPDKYNTEEVNTVRDAIFKEFLGMEERMREIPGDYSIQEW